MGTCLPSLSDQKVLEAGTVSTMETLTLRWRVVLERQLGTRTSLDCASSIRLGDPQGMGSTSPCSQIGTGGSPGGVLLSSSDCRHPQ